MCKKNDVAFLLLKSVILLMQKSEMRCVSLAKNVAFVLGKNLEVHLGFHQKIQVCLPPLDFFFDRVGLF